MTASSGACRCTCISEWAHFHSLASIEACVQGGVVIIYMLATRHASCQQMDFSTPPPSFSAVREASVTTHTRAATACLYSLQGNQLSIMGPVMFFFFLTRLVSFLFGQGELFKTMVTIESAVIVEIVAVWLGTC